MQKTLIGFLIICLSSSFCINTYHINQHGQDFYSGVFSSFPIFYQSFNKEFHEDFILKMEESLTGSPDIDSELLLNKSASLIKLGKIKTAKNILQKLYNEKPNEYNVIANLGTLYELEGKVDSAIIFINRAIEIDTNSHKGSEWFHIKVLEAKKALQNDKNWLINNKVLNLHLPELERDTVTIDDNIDKIFKDIAYQLAERIPFSNQNDFILANIFNEYGELLSKVSIQLAYVAYEIGHKYDENNFYKMDEKSKKMRLLIQKNEGLRVPRTFMYYPKSTAFSKNPLILKIGLRIHQNIAMDRADIRNARIVTTSIILLIIGLIVGFVIIRRKRKSEA